MRLRRLIADQVWAHIVQDESLSAVDIGNYVRLLPHEEHYDESLRAKAHRLHVSVETLRKSTHRLARAGWVDVRIKGRQ